LADSQEARRRADAAAERVRTEFSADTMVAKVESIYTELLDGEERHVSS
jgi:hypothetical protein